MNLRMQLQGIYMSANLIFRLGQARVSSSSELLFDALQSIGAAQPWVCARIVNRSLCQNILDGFTVSERYLLKPIHHLAQVILTDFEAQRERCQRLPIGRRPTKHTLERVPGKAPPASLSLAVR